MIVAVLEFPEVFLHEGIEYRAGNDLPLNKGQAQQLAKVLLRQEIKVGFRYEDRPDDGSAERSVDRQENIRREPDDGSSAADAGNRSADGIGLQDHRGNTDVRVSDVGEKARRKPGRPRRNA